MKQLIISLLLLTFSSVTAAQSKELASEEARTTEVRKEKQPVGVEKATHSNLKKKRDSLGMSFGGQIMGTTMIHGCFGC